jgi:hypothetical protein
MNDEPTTGRGESFREEIRSRYPAELADRILTRVQDRDDIDNAEAATSDATRRLEMEFAYYVEPVDIEQAFQVLDRLRETQPDDDE